MKAKKDKHLAVSKDIHQWIHSFKLTYDLISIENVLQLFKKQLLSNRWQLTKEEVAAFKLATT